MNISNDDYWMDAEKMPPACSGDYLCIVGIHYALYGTIIDYAIKEYDADLKSWASRNKVLYWTHLPEMPDVHKAVRIKELLNHVERFKP